MAMGKEIIDERGVKTNYHAIKSFWYDKENLKVLVKVYSYVSEDIRENEKVAQDSNERATAYDRDLAVLRSELDSYLGLTDEASIAKIGELSAQVNALTLDTERPQYASMFDTHYSENEVAIDFFEPLTIEAIYEVISGFGLYAGAENV